MSDSSSCDVKNAIQHLSALKLAAQRPGEPPNTWECESITGVPDGVRREMKLHSFYQKYLHAFGVPIISSNRVKDAALRRACYVVVFTLADRQDIRRMFYKNHGRAGIIAVSEGTTTIPEHSWLPSWWNQRARGLGGTMHSPISTCRYSRPYSAWCEGWGDFNVKSSGVRGTTKGVVQAFSDPSKVP